MNLRNVWDLNVLSNESSDKQCCITAMTEHGRPLRPIWGVTARLMEAPKGAALSARGGETSRRDLSDAAGKPDDRIPLEGEKSESIQAAEAVPLDHALDGLAIQTRLPGRVADMPVVPL